MPHPFSDVRAFRRDPLALLLERGRAAKHSLERLYLGTTPIFLVADPELIKPLLKMPETEVGKGRLIPEARAGVRAKLADASRRGAQAAPRRLAPSSRARRGRAVHPSDVRGNSGGRRHARPRRSVQSARCDSDLGVARDVHSRVRAPSRIGGRRAGVGRRSQCDRGRSRGRDVSSLGRSVRLPGSSAANAVNSRTQRSRLWCSGCAPGPNKRLR